MKLLNIFFIYAIAICSAFEDTQDREPVDFNGELEEFVRRLTQQQMQATQNAHSSLLPLINIPRMRARMGNGPGGVESSLPLFKIPFQSTSGQGGSAQSYASSSVNMKRPHTGEASVEAQASAYASVKDVNNEESMGDRFSVNGRTSSDRFSLDENSSPSEYQKSTTLQEEFIGISDDADDVSKIGQPSALKQQQVQTVIKADDSFSDVYFVAIVAGCCAIGIFGVISAGICFYRLQKSRKAAADVDYPAYGVTGPNKDVSSPNGDRKLAQSAQMYHYQHQKQQMIAVEKAGSTKNTSASDVDSEEENEEGDYTVYECPGLAPTGEMEVKNPLFHDDSTPVSPPILPSKPDSNQNN